MQETTIKTKDTSALQGAYVIRTHSVGQIKYETLPDGSRKVDLESLKMALKSPQYEHPLIHNLVVSGTTGYGRNLLARVLVNDTTYGGYINTAKIGTGNTAPTNADTDIETVGLAGITVALAEVSDNIATFTFFIPNVDLANATYKEFTMHIGTSNRLFCRSLITPNFTKGSNQDTTVEYTLTLT